MARSPHDALFQFTFRQVEHAAGLFRSQLPPALVVAIDWSTLRLQDGSFIDKRLRRQQSDLLLTARMGAREVPLYLVVEHKARNERRVVVQLLGYVMAIWKALLRRRPRVRELPLLVPIVLHHGRRPWRGPRDLTGLLAGKQLAASLRAALMPLQPTFRPLVVSLRDWPPERIRSMALTVFGKLTLEALQRLPGASLPEILETIRQWGELVRHLARAPSATDALSALWTYVLDTAEAQPEQVIEVVDEVMEAETTMKKMTAGAILRDEGRVEGRVEGRTELLLRLLTARFGELALEVNDRIRSATAEQVGRWAVRTLDAASLDDVFGQA